MCGRVERNWRDLNGLLSQTVEQFSSRGGGAPIEAEREFVEIVFEVFWGDASLMRAQQPTFEQRDDPMHPQQQMLGIGRLVNRLLSALATVVMWEISHGKPGCQKGI